MTGVFHDKKEILKDNLTKQESRLKSTTKTSIGSEESFEKGERNSRISEWLKPTSELQEEIHEESSNKKYYVIAAMLILTCLSWYYFDDIKPVGASLIERIRSFRPRPGDDPGNVRGNVPTNTTESLKTRLKGLFSKEDNNSDLYHIDNSSQAKITPISLEDRTPVASSSRVTFNDSIDVIPPIEPQLTGLTNISNDHFEESSNAVLSEIDQYFRTQNNHAFPTVAIQTGLYKIIKNRISTLGQMHSDLYCNLVQDRKISNRIERFLDAEKDLVTETYPEVAQASAQEQDVWSDRSSSPSVQSPIQQSIDQVLSPDMTTYAIDDQQIADYRKELSPIQHETLIENKGFQKAIVDNFNKSDKMDHEMSAGPSPIKSNITTETTIEQNLVDPPRAKFNSLFEAIKARKKNIMSSPEISEIKAGPSKFSPLIDDAHKLNDPDLLKAINKTFDDDLRSETSESSDRNKELPTLPDIKLDSSSSSENSEQHYFTEPALSQEEANTGMNALLEGIRKRRDDSNVIGSPNIAQVGLQPTSSPLLSTKTSLSNLFDDTMNLFEDDVSDTIIEQSIDKGKGKATDEFIEAVKPDHQLRRQSSSLSKPTLDINPIVDWDSAKIELIERNDERIFRIYFGDTWRNAHKIHLRTNDNYISTIDFEASMIPDWSSDSPKIITFDWGNKFNKLDSLGYKSEIYDISIEDIKITNITNYLLL
jgi:hypothetical protein